MSFLVKVCGLNSPDSVAAALDAGADMVGFVFFARSPRHVSLDAARRLAVLVGGRAQKVVLSVDADDAALADICAAVAPDLLQLHGRETAARTAEVRARFGRPVIRAIPVAEASDLECIDAYEDAADILLFDARPPADANRPGGHGARFDWGLLEGLNTARPWLLAGGLDAGNVEEAIRVTGANGVDVSSGVESSPGVKDPAKVAEFVARARHAAALGMAPAIL